MSTQPSTKSDEKKPIDLLMWVGGKYYTVETFTSEAIRLGCCRRISIVPQEAVLGKSRVFLIHDVSTKDPSVKVRKVRRRSNNKNTFRTFKVKERTSPMVFGYFTLAGIAFVGDKQTTQQVLRNAAVKVYDFDNRGFSEVRGCGYIKLGGTYMIDQVQLSRLQGLHVKDLRGGFHSINPPIVVPDMKRWRGWKYVYGDKILSNAPVGEWYPAKPEPKPRSPIRTLILSTYKPGMGVHQIFEQISPTNPSITEKQVKRTFRRLQKAKLIGNETQVNAESK